MSHGCPFIWIRNLSNFTHYIYLLCFVSLFEYKVSPHSYFLLAIYLLKKLYLVISYILDFWLILLSFAHFNLSRPFLFLSFSISIYMFLGGKWEKMPGGCKINRWVTTVLISILGLPTVDWNPVFFQHISWGQYYILLHFVCTVLCTEFYRY